MNVHRDIRYPEAPNPSPSTETVSQAFVAPLPPGEVDVAWAIRFDVEGLGAALSADVDGRYMQLQRWEKFRAPLQPARMPIGLQSR